MLSALRRFRRVGVVSTALSLETSGRVGIASRREQALSQCRAVSNNLDVAGRNEGIRAQGALRQQVPAYQSRFPGQSIPREDRVVKMFKEMVAISSHRSYRFAHAEDEPDAITWEKCKAFAIENLTSTSSYRIAHVLKCCKDGSFLDEELCHCLIRSALGNPDILQSFVPVGVSMSVQSLGMLARFAKKENLVEASTFFKTTVREFAEALLSNCIERGLFKSQQYGVRELSNTMHGIGLLFSQDGSESDPELESIMYEIVEAFVDSAREEQIQPQSFSNLLLGCAYAGFENLDLLSQICGLLVDEIENKDGMGEQALANSVWALGRMGFGDEDLLETLAGQISSERRLEGFSDQELANLVEGLGLMGFDNLPALTWVAKEISKNDRLEGFKQQELANVLFGVGLLGLEDNGVLAALTSQISKPRRLSRFKGQALGRIISALGDLDYHDRDLLTCLGQEIVKGERLGKYSQEELDMIVDGFQRLKFWVDPVLTRLHEEVEARASNFSPRYWRH
ncbi:hypothetical protein BSKO_11443 [Bryopsis sp. KO-2023]|nr:hypothetical protein BSKO_11443 [Bryopsis sp. KO-2023]